MEKTLSMGAFTELDEREVMETEGGFLQGFFDWVCGANTAKENAENLYNRCKDELATQINNDGSIITSVPQAAIDYFDIKPTNGGSKGIWGGVH